MPPRPSDHHEEISARVAAVASFLRDRDVSRPVVGLILGTGLGGLAEEVRGATSIRYDDIPHFPRATAIGHKGQLTFGLFGRTPVVVMEGRFHRYEGYNNSALALPIQVMRRLGVELLIATNACGGLHPNHEVGELVVIDDHLDLMFGRFLGSSATSVMDSPGSGTACYYDPNLVDLALSIARRQGTVAHRGVYVGVTGPNYETRAEYRLFRRIGGDAIGMSTIPEVTEAARLGMRVLALSTITNVCRPDALGTTEGSEVAAAAAAAAPRLCALLRELLEALAIAGPETRLPAVGSR